MLGFLSCFFFVIQFQFKSERGSPETKRDIPMKLLTLGLLGEGLLSPSFFRNNSWTAADIDMKFNVNFNTSPGTNPALFDAKKSDSDKK